MNTRQLSQGMKPTLEFERKHTFKSFRQFPELRKSVNEIESIAFASADPLYHMRSDGIKREKQHRSTHRLAELSQSSLLELSSVMDDFRKIMIENRRKNMATSGARPVSSQNSLAESQQKQNQYISSSTSSLIASVIPQRKSSSRQREGTDQDFVGDDDITGNIPIQSFEGPSDEPPSSDEPSSLSPKQHKPSSSRPSFLQPNFEHQGSFFSSSNSSAYDPLLRANEKLKKIALSFDHSSSNSHLAGFQGSKLQKKEFEMILRRCLNIHLKTNEFDALFQTMDADNSGLIDGVEFIRYFFHLGNEAKTLIHLETKERQRRQQARIKEKKERAVLRELNWQKSQISSFCKSDVETLHQKLRKAAFLYDPNNEIDHSVLHRLRAYLSPYVFQLQVSKCFQAQGMRLNFTGPELAALISEFLVKDNQFPPEPTKPHLIAVSSPQTKEQETAAEEERTVLTEENLDSKVDGYAFVTHFVHLCQAMWKEHTNEQRRLQYRRLRVLEMGQHTDIMPKSLGR